MTFEQFKDFQEIVTSFALYLHNQHALGMESLPSRDGKKILRTIDKMIEELKKKKSLSELKTITLEEVRKELEDCKRCRLYSSRTQIVFGKGKPNASLVFVGEAPGREEDLAGEPFVGEAGRLLTRIINAINLKREEVFITNVIKCRPPNNRDPKPEEIKACLPFLKKQLQAIRPRLICALGRIAAQTLLETTERISRLRGKIFEFQNIKVVPTFHPASLLRNPQWKREVWKDIQLVQKLLEENQ
jgi:DNA polymerase